MRAIDKTALQIRLKARHKRKENLIAGEAGEKESSKQN